MKKIISACMAILVFLVLFGCGAETNAKPQDTEQPPVSEVAPIVDETDETPKGAGSIVEHWRRIKIDSYEWNEMVFTSDGNYEWMGRGTDEATRFRDGR